MITILATIFVLGFLVFIHETGHFLAAKIFRIRVDRFSMGFPPRMIGKKIGDTDYCISWIPFGGYVKIAGMVDESMDKKELSKEPQPWEYRSRPWIQRFIVILAGPLMNLLFTLVVFTIAAVMSREVQVPLSAAVVGDVSIEMPAHTAGIRPGDRIIKIDDREIESWDDMTGIIHNSAGDTLTIEWMRNDSLFHDDVVPMPNKYLVGWKFKKRGLIGIAPDYTIKKVGAGRAIIYGSENMYFMVRLILVSLSELITGQESVRNLGGPVVIAKMAGESARSGIAELIGFMAFLSLNLAILNLLPIPVLDGGHIMFLVVEGIARRPIPMKAKMIIQQVFMALLLAFMVFVIFNDILRVFC